MLPISLYIFALFFLGHVFGDFLLQTEAIAKGKQRETRILLWHVTQHVLSTIVLVGLGWTRLHFAAPGAFPGLSELAIGVGTIAATHLVIDKLKILADQRWGSRASFFVVDQLAHVTVLTLVVTWLGRRHGDWGVGDFRPIFVLGQPHAIAHVATAVFLVAALLYALRGGAILAWLVTASTLNGESDEQVHAAGITRHPLRDDRRLYLGYAERLAGLGLLLAGVFWGGIVLGGFLLFYLGRALWLMRAARRKGWSSLWARYRIRELAASAVTVVVVGTWAHWMVS
jgi:hypothetical protein